MLFAVKTTKMNCPVTEIIILLMILIKTSPPCDKVVFYPVDSKRIVGNVIQKTGDIENCRRIYRLRTKCFALKMLWSNRSMSVGFARRSTSAKQTASYSRGTMRSIRHILISVSGILIFFPTFILFAFLLIQINLLSFSYLSRGNDLFSRFWSLLLI